MYDRTGKVTSNAFLTEEINNTPLRGRMIVLNSICNE